MSSAVISFPMLMPSSRCGGLARSAGSQRLLLTDIDVVRAMTRAIRQLPQQLAGL